MRARCSSGLQFPPFQTDPDHPPNPHAHRTAPGTPRKSALRAAGGGWGVPRTRGEGEGGFWRSGERLSASGGGRGVSRVTGIRVRLVTTLPLSIRRFFLASKGARFISTALWAREGRAGEEELIEDRFSLPVLKRIPATPLLVWRASLGQQVHLLRCYLQVESLLPLGSRRYWVRHLSG